MKTIQEYLLDCLQEECAELIQIISKAKRFGVEDVWPNKEKNPEQYTNERRMHGEYNDILGTAELLHDSGIIIFPDFALTKAKQERIRKFLEYSRSKGLVE